MFALYMPLFSSSFMRLPRSLRPLLFVLLALTAALPACKKNADSVTVESATPENTFTESHDAGTVAWAVSPEGQVRVVIKPSGGAVDPGATGTVTVRPASGGASAPIKLVFDQKAGLHVATVPKLDAELTELAYDISVKGKSAKGTLHLPQGGTDELLKNAKKSSGKTLKDKKGPSGGVVQVVGGDILEIVADEKTGETRVYVLDDDFKVVAVGKRRIKLAVVGAGPEVIELKVGDNGQYFTGKLVSKGNPAKLTVVLYEEGDTVPVVVLYGWAPGTVVVVGARATVVPLYVVTTWSTVVVVNPAPTKIIVVHKGKGKGKGKKKKH
jgi:hypothetical protein